MEENSLIIVVARYMHMFLLHMKTLDNLKLFILSDVEYQHGNCLLINKTICVRTWYNSISCTVNNKDMCFDTKLLLPRSLEIITPNQNPSQCLYVGTREASTVSKAYYTSG